MPASPGNMRVPPAPVQALQRVTGCREVRTSAQSRVTMLRGYTGDVLSLVALPDGRLASGGGTVRLWDTARGGDAVAVLEGHGGCAHGLAALPEGRHLAAGVWGSDFEGIVRWDVLAEPPVRRATIYTRSGVRALVTLPDCRLAAGCNDNTARIVDAEACAEVATLSGHTSHVAALAVLPDGRLASASADTTVPVWDLAREECVAALDRHRDWVRALAVLPDGRLASGAADGDVIVWDLDMRTSTVALAGYANYVLSLAALPDGRLASGSDDSTIRLWDVRGATGNDCKYDRTRIHATAALNWARRTSVYAHNAARRPPCQWLARRHGAPVEASSRAAVPPRCTRRRRVPVGRSRSVYRPNCG